MRLMCLACVMLCGFVYAADSASDDADYAAYKAEQEQATQAKDDLDRRAAAVVSLENELANVKAKYPGKTVDESLAQWREDIRKVAVPAQRFAAYECLKRAEGAVARLKASTKAATAEDAVTAEKADIQAKR